MITCYHGHDLPGNHQKEGFEKRGENAAASTAQIEDAGNDLALIGPVLPAWPNFSKLSQDEYHCHLAHKWVACWRADEGEIEIEVYYAGSRENAPY